MNLQMEETSALHEGRISALMPDKSCGFIRCINFDKDVFFPYSSIDDYDTNKLRVGQKVKCTPHHSALSARNYQTFRVEIVDRKRSCSSSRRQKRKEPECQEKS